MTALEHYSELIDGWANQVATAFASGVARHSEKEWRQNSMQIGAELRDIINNAPTGQVMRSIVAEQVKYIKSLPLEAAEHIYDIQNRAIEMVSAGGRAGDFTKEIASTGDVAASRARLIARTETGRAVTALTQARALASGSVGYIWRTADDGDVRHSHAEMEGLFVYWTNPPTLDGMTGHAGALPNCRCWCEVVFAHSNVVPLRTGDGLRRIVTIDGVPVRVAA